MNPSLALFVFAFSLSLNAMDQFVLKKQIDKMTLQQKDNAWNAFNQFFSNSSCDKSVNFKNPLFVDAFTCAEQQAANNSLQMSHDGNNSLTLDQKKSISVLSSLIEIKNYLFAKILEDCPPTWRSLDEDDR